MPTTLNIPQRTESHCEPCEFLKRSNMICSRLGGIKCDYNCTNPKCYDDLPISDDALTRGKQIAMREQNAKRGRFIGKEDIQPKWCPLLNHIPLRLKG